MVTFRNNTNRRNSFKRNDKNFKLINDRNKLGSGFSNNDNFQRKSPGRNNHNASKLIEKYNNLAREALSAGDKILSENYFQHAIILLGYLRIKKILRKIDFQITKTLIIIFRKQGLEINQNFKEEISEEKKLKH